MGWGEWEGGKRSSRGVGFMGVWESKKASCGQVG